MNSIAKSASDDDLLQFLQWTCRAALRLFNEYQFEHIEPELKFSALSAATRVERYARKHYGPAGEWPPDYGRKLTARSYSYLCICQQHFAGMESLLTNRPYGLPIGPLVRSIVEASGRSAWLIDPTLDIRAGTRTRVARLLMDEEDDAKQRKALVSGLSAKGGPQAGVAWKQAKDRISKAGIFYSSELGMLKPSGKRTVRGESLPGPKGFVIHAERVLGNTTAENADLTYGYLSAMTHPSLFAFYETLDTEATIIGVATPVLGVKPAPLFTAKLVSHALHVFCNSFRLFASWTATPITKANTLVRVQNCLSRRIANLNFDA